MGIYYNTRTVRDGLVLHLDAANVKSYPGTGNTWFDLSGNGNDFTLDSTGITFSSNESGQFLLADGGTYRQSTLTTSSTATCVFWIKTTDTQALFLSGDVTAAGAYYLGAYRVGNKEYYGNCGSPAFYMDTVDTPNIYDYIRDGNWHMLEFKNVNFNSQTWPHFEFNKYTDYNFANGALSALMIYDKVLTADESKQNFEAIRGRYGI